LLPSLLKLELRLDFKDSSITAALGIAEVALTVLAGVESAMVLLGVSIAA
jgi:hypothetical protein